jgi:hypothetical protein
MARLKKTHEGERRTCTLTVQLSPTERAEIGRAASSWPTVSEFARSRLLASGNRAPTPARPTHDPKTATALLGELGKIGSNINQMARRANAADRIPEEAVLLAIGAELKAALDRLV